MKTLFKKTFIFISIPLIYLSLITSFNYYQIKESKPTIPIVNYLILGDSHIQNSIDSDYFNNAVNYAKSGEPYFVSFWKLKHLISHPNVFLDTVLLGFSHHDISEKKDNSLSDAGASVQFKRNYSIHIFTKQDSVDTDYFKYFNVLLRNVAAYPKLNHHGFQGKYSRLKKKLTKREFHNEPFQNHNHFYDKNNEYGISRTNLNYLDSIVSLCNSQDIELKLVATPVSKKYYENIPNKFLVKYEELKSIYRMNRTPVYDFSQVIIQDSLFADFNHLNEVGSQLFMKRNFNRNN